MEFTVIQNQIYQKKTKTTNTKEKQIIHTYLTEKQNIPDYLELTFSKNKIFDNSDEDNDIISTEENLNIVKSAKLNYSAKRTSIR